MEFAIVDIETTGSHYGNECITEIGIVITDGKNVLDTYETLVNPNARIPKFITYLTGITEEMVADAPTFDQVARDIYSYLDGRVFVAHNVNFDYKIVKAQMDQVGYSIPSKRLCTVRLSRKLLPGYPSYSLGKLSASLGLKHQNAHRAMGDAKVTAELFEILVSKDDGEIAKSLKSNSKEATLPSNLSKETFEKIPEKTGVYYFYNAKGKIIYIGKAKNLKKRVSSHFIGKNNLDKRGFLEEIFDVSYELTGNEVVASLLEEGEIKQYWPIFNSAQKAAILKYGVFKYMDQAGNIRLGINKISNQYRGIMQFPSLSKARTWLLEKMEAFELNPTFCGMQIYENHSIDSAAHEKNIKKFLREYLALEETIVWTGMGRSHGERAFVLMQKGVYMGFGYVEEHMGVDNLQTLHDYLIPQHDTQVIRKILGSPKYNSLRKIVLKENLSIV